MSVDARSQLAQAHQELRGLALFMEIGGDRETADRLVEIADRVQAALDDWTAQAEIPFLPLFRATEAPDA